MRLQDVNQPEQLQGVQASFDAELREYRDKTRDQIERVRREIKAATKVVETFANSVTSNGTELEAGLKRGGQRLNQAATSVDLNEVRTAIHSAPAKVTAGVEQLRLANQLVVAQLKMRFACCIRRSGQPAPTPAKISPPRRGGRRSTVKSKR